MFISSISKYQLFEILKDDLFNGTEEDLTNYLILQQWLEKHNYFQILFDCKNKNIVKYLKINKIYFNINTFCVLLCRDYYFADKLATFTILE